MLYLKLISYAWWQKVKEMMSIWTAASSRKNIFSQYLQSKSLTLLFTGEAYRQAVIIFFTQDAFVHNSKKIPNGY